MKINDFRETYYTLSGKASDVARQLSLAGIALIWIFKADIGGPLEVPEQLILPAALFVMSLALDLFQYASGSLIWATLARYHEVKKYSETKELAAPIYANWPSLFCFWVKLLTVSSAYVLVFNYTTSLLPKT